MSDQRSVDLVEVTTYLTGGPAGSGPLLVEQAQAFYRGYGRERRLTDAELKSFESAHLFHQLFFLADALARGDYWFIDRMEDRLTSWRGRVLGQLTEIASDPR